MKGIMRVSLVSALSATLCAGDIRERVVEVDEAQIFCRVMGEEREDKSAVVVLHGGPGLSQDYLLPQMQELAKKHFVIFYDQRGCGLSRGGEDAAHITTAQFVTDLEAVRKAFALKKFSVIGHSWGGFLAMHYAMRHEKNLDKLILLNTLPASSADIALFINEYVRRMTPYFSTCQEIQTREEFAAGDSESFADYYRTIFRTYCAEPESADKLNLWSLPESNIRGLRTADLFRSTLISGSFDLSSELKKLSCKTVIIHGDQDPIPLETVERIRDYITDSQFFVIKNCGHFPYIEQPKEFFSFLESVLI